MQTSLLSSIAIRNTMENVPVYQPTGQDVSIGNVTVDSDKIKQGYTIAKALADLRNYITYISGVGLIFILFYSILAVALWTGGAWVNGTYLALTTLSFISGICINFNRTHLHWITLFTSLLFLIDGLWGVFGIVTWSIDVNSCASSGKSVTGNPCSSNQDILGLVMAILIFVPQICCAAIGFVTLKKELDNYELLTIHRRSHEEQILNGASAAPSKPATTNPYGYRPGFTPQQRVPAPPGYDTMAGWYQPEMTFAKQQQEQQQQQQYLQTGMAPVIPPTNAPQGQNVAPAPVPPQAANLPPPQVAPQFHGGGRAVPYTQQQQRPAANF